MLKVYISNVSMYLQLQIFGRHLPATIHAASAATWIVLQRPHPSTRVIPYEPIPHRRDHGNYMETTKCGNEMQQKSQKNLVQTSIIINIINLRTRKSCQTTPCRSARRWKGLWNGSDVGRPIFPPDGFSTKHLFWGTSMTMETLIWIHMGKENVNLENCGNCGLRKPTSW
jgi:hypothetical protein